MPNLDRWTQQSRMSKLGVHAYAIGELPFGLSGLVNIVQGLLVHEAWLGAYGLDERDYRGISRATLSVAERLSRIAARDSRPLQIPREPGEREIGTCRDFALMLCALLRSVQIPSRVRCGFAAYFAAGWEDHWVCEYWDRQTELWRLCDPQLDDVLRRRCRIAFDPMDVPRDAFLTAGQAWSACRDNRADPADFGHGEVTGAWFIKVNVVRDHYVVNNCETSVWDGWRAAAFSQRVVPESETPFLDDLADRPEQLLVERVPDWLEPE
jgi:Transglutaminase-like superfamily